MFSHDTLINAEIEVLRAGFDYQCDFSHGSPSPEYYWFRKRQRVLRLIAKHFPTLVTAGSASWKFADLGCGDGVDLFLIRKKIRELAVGSTQHSTPRPPETLRFVGIDGNPTTIRLCDLKRTHYDAQDTELFTCDLTGTLPFSSGELSFVYCSEVLEHLRDPERFLAEVRRVLSSHGHLMITTPNEPNIFQRSFWYRDRRRRIREDALSQPTEVTNHVGKRLLLYGHVCLRTATEWDAVLASEGFELVDAQRGAVLYTPLPRLNPELAFGLQLFLEATLDLLPVSWVRSISDQVIGLYRKID